MNVFDLSFMHAWLSLVYHKREETSEEIANSFVMLCRISVEPFKFVLLMCTMATLKSNVNLCSLNECGIAVEFLFLCCKMFLQTLLDSAECNVWATEEGNTPNCSSRTCILNKVTACIPIAHI